MRNFLHWLNANDYRKGWQIAWIAIVVLAAGLGLRDPWPPDEPALALMARYMADSGEWLIPYLRGEPFVGHPPFAIWLMAAFYDVTGSLRLSVLLPSLLASLGTLWLIYDLGKRLWGARVGRLAATALLCTFQFMLQAHRGQVDALLMFWNTLALYGLIQFMLLDANLRSLRLAGWAVGLGILTKGLGYLPMLILVPYFWMRRRQWPTLPQGRQLRGLWVAVVTALGVVLAWALPALGFVSGADDQGLDEFRRSLLVNLVGGADILPNDVPRPWWYLPSTAMLMWLPLSLLLPWKVGIWRDRIRARDPAITLLLTYILLVIAFLAALRGKHGVQLVLIVPAMALLMAPYLGGLWWRPGVQRLSVGVLWCISALLLLAWLGRDWLTQRSPRIPADISDALWTFLVALGVLGVLVSLVLRGRRRALGLPVYFFLSWLLLGFWAFPMLNDVRTPRPIYAEVEARMPADAPLALLGWKPQMELYASRPLQIMQSLEQACVWLQDGSERYLLGPRAELGELAATAALDAGQLGQRHGAYWVLLGPGAMSGRPCRGGPELMSAQ